MILVTSINMIVIPLDVSFYGQQTDIGWTVYNVLVDIAFVVDLCLNFRMGYYHENLEVRVCVFLPKA